MARVQRDISAAVSVPFCASPPGLLVSSGCASPPGLSAAGCVYIWCASVCLSAMHVFASVFIWHKCACLCFPFCSISTNVGETSVFNQGPGNCLTATLATVLLMRPIGSDFSYLPRGLSQGTMPKALPEGSLKALPASCMPNRKTEAQSGKGS